MKAAMATRKMDNNELLFFVSYSIYLIFSILNTSFFAVYFSNLIITVMIMCVLLLIAKELFCNKIGKRELLLLLACSIMSAILFFHTNGSSMFPLPFFIYGARNIDFKKIAKLSIAISSALLIIVFISAKTGLITDYISHPNGRARDYIGFRYALYPSVLMFNITALIIYLDKKNALYKYLLLLAINAIVFMYTDSRLSFYSSALLIVLAYIAKKTSSLIGKMKLASFVMVFSFVICSILSMALISNYDSSNTTMRKADIVLENRLSLGKASLNEYPISMFGQDVEYIGSGLTVNGKKSTKNYNYVDCLYLNMLEKYGILFFIMYILLTTYSLSNLKKRGEHILLLIMAIIAARSMIDDLSIYLYYNSFWFIISDGIIHKTVKEKKEI